MSDKKKTVKGVLNVDWWLISAGLVAMFYGWIVFIYAKPSVASLICVLSLAYTGFVCLYRGLKL